MSANRADSSRGESAARLVGAHLARWIEQSLRCHSGSDRFYEAKHRWHITLFLLMADHLHTLLSFAGDEPISKVIGDWKHFQRRKHGIIWQEGYFDHRLRDDERGEQLSAKMNYIRQNPVVAGLCTRAEDWPWIIDRSA